MAWRLSNTLDASFCTGMLDEALARGRPEAFNTDQGVRFTAEAFPGRLESAGVAVSMDGRGRALDNVFVECLGRAVQYEGPYIQGDEEVPELRRGLARYFAFCSHARLHQALGYRTPAAVYAMPARCDFRLSLTANEEYSGCEPPRPWSGTARSPPPGTVTRTRSGDKARAA
jgi:putative transposase